MPFQAWDFEYQSWKEVLGKLGYTIRNFSGFPLGGSTEKRVALAKAILEKPDLLLLERKPTEPPGPRDYRMVGDYFG